MKFVIATVLETKGSTPRETGAKILISADTTFGTIGGGKLEYQVTNTARELLAGTQEPPFSHQQEYILGTELGQCCGGRLSIDYQATTDASLWQDPLLQANPLFNIVLFGAGHVGQAIINILATQPCQVHWVDNRPELFPSTVPPNVQTYLTESPTSLVTEMPANSYYLVMTHDHGLDLDLCDHVLSRSGFRFLGLIGSQTKAERFKRQLLRRGLEQQDIDQMTCPIGIKGISGKLPSSIALGVVTQLVGLEETVKHMETSIKTPLSLGCSERNDDLEQKVKENSALPLPPPIRELNTLLDEEHS